MIGSGKQISGTLVALVFFAGAATAADHFEMLPSDTDPTIIAPFQMLESDIPPSAASQQTVFDGNNSAGSASLETGPDEAIIFRDDATASSASIVNNGGQTYFNDRTTAAASSLTANEDGYVRFSDTATAADSRIVINDGGRLDLAGNATAGSAFITNNAYLRFGETASASNAEITINGNGVLAFRNNADAGIARIANNGLTGFFDSSNLAGSLVTNNGTGFLLFADDSNAGTTSFISNSGTVVFADRSTLGDAAITNNATGILRFEDSSNAGTGFISSSGGLIFTDHSSAASADMVGNLGGLILFRDSSSAANSTISGGSHLRFSGNSTAAAATITMAPGTILSFVGNAQGDTANVQLDSGSSLDIASARNPISFSRLTGAGQVSLGSNVLVFGDSTPLVNFAGNIGDGGLGGGLIKRGTGTVNLSGSSSYSGPTSVNAGTLEAGAQNSFSSQSAFSLASGAALALAGFDQQIGSLAGSGRIDLAAGSVLTTGGNNRSTTFSGHIEGSGGLTKAGSGEFALTGASTYSGNTRVLDGRLRADGDISSSTITVEQGGVLLGHGRIGSADISGTLLGEADGVGLSIVGDLALADSSTTELEISGAQSGRFDVIGTATLAGTLSIQPSSPIIPNRQYVFLTAGLVVGTYDALQSGYAFLDPTVVYGPNFAAFELARNAASFSSVGNTRNQRATARAIESLAAGNAVFDAILVLTAEDARVAFDNLSGEGHAAAISVTSIAQSNIRRAVLSQIDDEARSNVWGVAQRSNSRIPSDDNGADIDFDDNSLIAGVDVFSISDMQLGVFGYLGETNLTLDERATWGNSQYAGAGIYGGWSLDRWRMRGLAAFSYNDFDLTRNISAGTLTGTARSSYPGWMGSASAELGYLMNTQLFSVEPYAGIDYSYLSTDGFDENGANAADLSSDGSSYSRLDAEFGVRASTTLRLSDEIAVKPSIGFSYIRNAVGAVASGTHRFSQSDEFKIYASRTAQDSTAIDLRINVAFSNGGEGDLYYRGVFQEGEYNQLLGAAFRLSF